MNPLRSFRDWRRYRNAVKDLSRMSDAQLVDLGIARGDIERVVRQG